MRLSPNCHAPKHTCTHGLDRVSVAWGLLYFITQFSSAPKVGLFAQAAPLGTSVWTSAGSRALCEMRLGVQGLEEPPGVTGAAMNE